MEEVEQEEHVADKEESEEERESHRGRGTIERRKDD